MREILLLNGPNLDMLGVREPEIYGRQTLRDIEEGVCVFAKALGIKVTCAQSNSEGELINAIHSAQGAYDGVVYNPGAHTHYSYALRDAVASIAIPVIEVHLSGISTREEFRRVSVIAPACAAQVKGLGVEGYFRAIELLATEKRFERLGEGYERRFDTSESIIVATRGQALFESDSAIQADVEAKASSDAVVQGAHVAPGAHVAYAVQGAHVADDALGAHVADDASGAHVAQSEASQPRKAAVTDYTAAFADALASTDAGLVSYQRQNMVREEFQKQGLSAVLVRDTSNIRWVTALDGVFDEERAHGLLIDAHRSVLHTDSRYANAVREAAVRVGSDIVVNDEQVTHARFAADAMTQNNTRAFAGKVGIEDTITYAEFVKMVEQFQTAGLASTTDLVLGLRSVKSPDEITRLKAAQAVTDAAFDFITGYMQPGMTEREVQLELEHFMLSHGAQGLAFRSIVAAGANGADPHAIPGDTRLEAGQCVVMDFGASAFGYCSDMTRTVFLGQPEGRMADAWEVLRRANESVEALLAPGVSGFQAHEEAERVLREGGFGGKMGHGVGHGVGMDVHELPLLNPRNDNRLVPGNVVTVEPGIYLPGEFGMRLEDFGVITEDGFEVFTQSTHEIVII